MARIRTIKPEFWTDEVMVQMPFEARLLFVGLWNFCDDYGYLAYEPERIRLQVLPSDDVNISELIDLLSAAGRVEVTSLKNGGRALHLPHFLEHQKISHPTESKIAPEVSGKVAIPLEVRRQVASKHGCKPGERADAACYYCGAPGSIWWVKTQKGRPSCWVAFGDLELDHFHSEKEGGEATENNIVLACRHCNRSKGTTHGFSFLLRKIPEDSGALRPEGNGKELKGKEDKHSAPAAPTLRTKNGKSLKGEHLERFEKFWTAFNYKRGKAEAADAWLSLSPDAAFAAQVIAAAAREAKGRAALVASGQTPKMAQGWLSARRFEDEDAPALPPAKNGNGTCPPVTDEKGLIAYGAKFGLNPKAGESWAQYRSRVVQASA